MTYPQPRALTSPSVVAVHCSVGESQITAGIFVVDLAEPTANPVTLYDVDSDASYSVWLPQPIRALSYQVELPLAAL